MTEWATYVVVSEQDEHELYDSRFGAFGLDIDLLAGPDVVLPFIRAHDGARSRWHDDVWCEAAALVDLRRRVLLFFVTAGPTVTTGLRSAALELLEHTWPGWELRWAYDGPAELREYLGLDPATVRSRDGIVYPGPPVCPADPEASEPDPLVSLVTVGADRCHLVADLGRNPVAEGPALLDRLAGAPNHGTCRLSPSSGIHVDPVRRRVGWWLNGRQTEAYEMAARWPGWEVEFWQDRWDEHVRAAGGRFAPPPIDRIGALDRLREAAHEHWRKRRDAQTVGPALAVVDAAWRKATGSAAPETGHGQ